MNAPSEAFLQTNPFAALTIVNACAAPLEALAPHQQLIRRELQQRGSLQSGDGVDHRALQHGLAALLDNPADPLCDLLRPCARSLAEGV